MLLRHSFFLYYMLIYNHMSKVQKRMKACSLRRKGMSLKKIAKELMVSSGSVSVWCRDIELTTKQIREINRRAHKGSAKGRAKGVTVNKNKKALMIQKHLPQQLQLV